MKKNIIKLLLVTVVSSQLSAFYDPYVGDTGWKQSEKNTLYAHCMAMVNGVDKWKRALPGLNNKTNVCECITDELMHRSTYHEFLLLQTIAFRKAGVENKKYFKNPIQTEEERRVIKKFKNLDKVVVDICGNAEVANKGVIEKLEEIKREHPNYFIKAKTIE